MHIFLSTLLLISSASASPFIFCNNDACGSEIRALPEQSEFCRDYELSLFNPPQNLPNAISACNHDPLRILSACLCVGNAPTSCEMTTTSTTTTTSHEITSSSTPTTLFTPTTGTTTGLQTRSTPSSNPMTLNSPTISTTASSKSSSTSSSTPTTLAPHTTSTTTSPKSSSTTTLHCLGDNCLRAFLATGHPGQLESAQAYCTAYNMGSQVPTSVYTSYAAACTSDAAGNVAYRMSSACSCIMTPITSSSSSTSTISTHISGTTTSIKSSSTSSSTPTTSTATSSQSSSTSSTADKTSSTSATTTQEPSSSTTTSKYNTVPTVTLTGSDTTTTTTTTTSTTASSSPTSSLSSTSSPGTTTTSPPAPTAIKEGLPITNVVGNGDFQYDASAPGGLADWLVIGDAKLVSGNAYHGDGNTGNYAMQLITGSAAARRRFRRQSSNGGAAGIEQTLADMDETTQYTVSLWYYVDYTASANAAPENCRIDAYYGTTLFSSTPYFASNTGQSSEWVQFISTFTPSTSNGNLEFLLDCINGGTAEALIDEVFVSNQVTPDDIDNISLTYALLPAATSTSSSQAPSSVPASSIAPPNPTCTIHIIDPFPAGATCQYEVATTGNPDELYIYGSIGISIEDCAAACLANPACGSMSWGPMSGSAQQCILYPGSVASYAVPASSSSGLYVWDQACWTYLGANGAACPSTTTTSTTQMAITTTMTTSTSSATGCSTTYPYPATTCTDLLPNPSPTSDAVCGVNASGNTDVYQGDFDSIAACQLGCLQSATCKSWSYSILCQFSDYEFLYSTLNQAWSEGGSEVWFDNECFYCAGDVPGSSCATTSSSTTTSSAPTNCPTQLVVNPSFETDSGAPWDFASFSSLQQCSQAQNADNQGSEDGIYMGQLNPGYVLYTYGPTNEPTSASITQSVSCFDPTQTYTVDFYWYLWEFYQSTNQGVKTTTCSVYVQIEGATVFNTTFDAAGSAQLSTWNYSHETANFVPPSATATLLVGADCLGDEAMINVDLITIYPAGGSSGLTPVCQCSS